MSTAVMSKGGKIPSWPIRIAPLDAGISLCWMENWVLIGEFAESLDPREQVY